MKVRWTAQAEEDRLDIMAYIAADNVRAAIRMDELFGEAASRLEEFPMLGKPGLVAGTREVITHLRRGSHARVGLNGCDPAAQHHC